MDENGGPQLAEQLPQLDDDQLKQIQEMIAELKERQQETF